MEGLLRKGLLVMCFPPTHDGFPFFPVWDILSLKVTEHLVRGLLMCFPPTHDGFSFILQSRTNSLC